MSVDIQELEEFEVEKQILMGQWQEGKEREGLGSRSQMILLALKSGGDISSLGSKGKEVRISGNVETFKDGTREGAGCVFKEVGGQIIACER